MSNLFFRKASHLAVKKTDSILENQRLGILRSFTAGILVASALLVISEQKADAAMASMTQAESSSVTSTSTSGSSSLSSSSVSKTTNTGGMSESSASSTESTSADSIRQSNKETSTSESSSMTVASTKDDSSASTASSQESSKAAPSSVNSSSESSENSSTADNTNSKAATSAEKTSEVVKTASNEASETTAVSSSSSSSSVSRASSEKSQTKIVAKSVKDATTEIDKVSIDDTTRPTVSAVDVSSYQSGMTLDNFKTLKNLGVKTVIVKLTEGASYTNPNALQQIKNANAAGLNVDIYHYATFNDSTSAKSEATYLNSVLTLNNVAKNILLIADVEDAATKVSKIGTYLNDFWSILNTAGYTNHGVYTNLGYEYLTDIVATVGSSRTWIAQYPYHPSSSNLLNTKYGAWQFSANGTLDGYTGALDLTIGYNGFLEDSAGSISFAAANQDPSTSATTKTVSTSNDQVKTGQQNIDGKWYLFDANGIMQTGFQYIAAQKKTVYYNTSGQMQYGQQYINSKWYLFDQNTGAMKTGFQYIAAQKKTVYYNTSGQMQYGQQYINSK
ncbi:GH25 family lysozyme, partial [Liquorilactobacillus uvarum]|uniref:GH25 family lysozyme n=1 Tax=Liquorilactobacillus uvarum TaxID=303240 RepID=UPI000AA59A0F